MTTSLKPQPVPRPRQCWKKGKQTLSTLEQSTPTKTSIQLSNDDMFQFLGTQFCPPRSPASFVTEDKYISHPVPVVPVTIKTPPKPPRSISSTSVDGCVKAPKPLPRTMFLAIKIPPKLASRPPFVNPREDRLATNETNSL